MTKSWADNVSLFVNEGAGTYQPARHFAANEQPRHIAPTDLDANGTIDIAVTNNTNTFANSLGILFNTIDD